MREVLERQLWHGRSSYGNEMSTQSCHSCAMRIVADRFVATTTCPTAAIQKLLAVDSFSIPLASTNFHCIARKPKLRFFRKSATDYNEASSQFFHFSWSV
mmetsp:Transcript_93669/g.200951  ORF Transcript_93669/g.200951 Transcript_93669/m.200951 type:complete len:100 (+) Transcript_93669:532-831(+)